MIIKVAGNQSTLVPALVLNLSETVSFRWLKIRIIGHLISETINLLISETFK